MVDINDLEAWLWGTPNSRRVLILFEELELNYIVHPINIRKGAQFATKVIALNPYGKIPIAAWTEQGARHSMFESGAILLHFTRMQPHLLTAESPLREETLTWFMMAMTSLGPMTGSAHHWTQLAPERSQAAIDHHVALVKRAYSALEERLTLVDFLARDYSLADIAAYPWIAVHDWASIDLDDYPAVKRWFARVSERPAVAKAMRIAFEHDTSV